jgi:hypothetical protein
MEVGMTLGPEFEVVGNFGLVPCFVFDSEMTAILKGKVYETHPLQLRPLLNQYHNLRN